MTTREKAAPAREPGEDTKAFAAWWLIALQRACAIAHVGFTVPYQRQNDLGEIVFEWSKKQPPKRTVRVFFEGQQATYMRLWGGESGHDSYAGGECSQIDNARLLMEWLGW
jgi:hypothetical protein